MFVLLVEDDSLFRRVVKARLDKEGFSTIEASNGLDAYNIIREIGASIDLLLTDINIPFMDGTSVAAFAKVQYPRMSIALMTADLSLCRSQTNGYVVLKKPIAWEELLRAVRDITSSQEPLHDQANEDRPTG